MLLVIAAFLYLTISLAAVAAIDYVICQRYPLRGAAKVPATARSLIALRQAAARIRF